MKKKNIESREKGSKSRKKKREIPAEKPDQVQKVALTPLRTVDGAAAVTFLISYFIFFFFKFLFFSSESHLALSLPSFAYRSFMFFFFHFFNFFLVSLLLCFSYTDTSWVRTRAKNHSVANFAFLNISPLIICYLYVIQHRDAEVKRDSIIY